MLSPTTSIGITNAAAPIGKSAPAQVQPVRAMNMPQDTAKPPATAAPSAPATPPRNLPRGSLLDLSV